MKKIIIITFFTSLLVLMGLVSAQDCKPGYEWQRMSGVGCVQSDCKSIPDAHYSSTKDCICGSSGSINENPNDPNKECNRPWEYESCPGCLYACVHADEPCPGEEIPVIVKDFEGSDDKGRDETDYWNEDEEDKKDEKWWDIFDIPYENNPIAQWGDDGPTFLDKINDKIDIIIGDVEYKACNNYEQNGVIGCVIKWDLEELDEHLCSPQEKLSTEIDSKTNEIFVTCKCKEEYKKVVGGCLFIPPKKLDLNNEDAKTLELAYRTIKGNEYKIIEIEVDGIIEEFIMMRRGNDELIFGQDGKWKNSLEHLLEPSAWQIFKDSNLLRKINPINWFHTKYKDPDKELKWTIAKQTLDAYKNDIKKPTHYRQTIYNYVKWSENKVVAMRTLDSFGIIKGGPKIIKGSLSGYAISFPGEAVKKFANELQTDDFAQAMSIYIGYRDEGKTLHELMNNPPADLDISISAGTASTMGPLLLTYKYEEGYQRYKAEKELNSLK